MDKVKEFCNQWYGICTIVALLLAFTGAGEIGLIQAFICMCIVVYPIGFLIHRGNVKSKQEQEALQKKREEQARIMAEKKAEREAMLNSMTIAEREQFLHNEQMLELKKKEVEAQEQNMAIQEAQLRAQEEQLKIQQKQFEAQKKCPKCGSTSLSGNKKGYGVVKGALGTAVGYAVNPVGAIVGLGAGNIGRNNVKVTCLNCGYKWKAGKK